MERLAGIMLWAIVPMLFAFAGMVGAEPVLVKRYFAEDRAVEWIGTVLFLFASIGFFATWLRHRDVAYLGIALICFFAFGEELSWGQRLFSWQTPEWWSRINTQSETNVHNLKWFHYLRTTPYLDHLLNVNLLNFGVLFRVLLVVWGVFIPLGVILSRRFERHCSTLRIPVISLWIGSVFVLIVVCSEITKGVASLHSNVVVWELSETLFAFVLLLIAASRFRGHAAKNAGKPAA